MKAQDDNEEGEEVTSRGRRRRDEEKKLVVVKIFRIPKGTRVLLLFPNQNQQKGTYDFLHWPASTDWIKSATLRQKASVDIEYLHNRNHNSCPADTCLIRQTSCKRAIYSLMMSFTEISTSLLVPRRSSLIRPAQNKRSGVGEGVRRKEVTSCTEFSLETTLRVFDQGEETSPPSVSINPVFTVISRKTSATTVHQRHQRFQSGRENVLPELKLRNWT